MNWIFKIYKTKTNAFITIGFVRVCFKSFSLEILFFGPLTKKQTRKPDQKTQQPNQSKKDNVEGEWS